MRITKFRGWNTKHKKRLYGDLFRSRGQWFITQDGIVTNPLAEPEDWRVEPETVGQSTGLFDKNGKEIYEEDIVKFKDKYYGVYRDEEYLEYYLMNGEDNEPMYSYADYEVIGNIHENSELINR